jgi:hypothetical protein
MLDSSVTPVMNFMTALKLVRVNTVFPRDFEATFTGGAEYLIYSFTLIGNLALTNSSMGNEVHANRKNACFLVVGHVL